MTVVVNTYKRSQDSCSVESDEHGYVQQTPRPQVYQEELCRTWERVVTPGNLVVKGRNTTETVMGIRSRSPDRWLDGVEGDGH